MAQDKQLTMRSSTATMEEWAGRVDRFLLADDRDILKDAGRISREIAKSHAESEFEKYPLIQDRLYESDFDKPELDVLKPDSFPKARTDKENVK